MKKRTEPARSVSDKVEPHGADLAYSTFLGGSADDWGFAVDLDDDGGAYVTGYTSSSDLPVSSHVVQRSFGGASDAFVAKIHPTGSDIVFATFLGGRERENQRVGEDFLSFQGLGDIVVDSDGYVVVTGSTYSFDFPVANAIQPTSGGGSDAFVVILDPIGSSVTYSSYVGGATDDAGTAVHSSDDGDLLLAGVTASSNFPLQDPLQSTYGGGPFDAFVTKLSTPLDVTVRTELDQIASGLELPVTIRLSNRTRQPRPVIVAALLAIPGLGSTAILDPSPLGLPPEHTVKLEPTISIPPGAPPGLWKIWAVVGHHDGTRFVSDDVSVRGFIVE